MECLGFEPWTADESTEQWPPPSISKVMQNYFLNRPTPASFSFIFGLPKQTLQFLQQINVKNVHPVYGAGIRTHNLQNVSLP